MSSESTSTDDHGNVDAVSPPRPSPPSDVPSQEIGDSTNASDSNTTPLVQEAPRNGTTASTIRAINDDDPPIPLWQVADHEKESQGPQLHVGPPGPPRFPHELDDSLAKKVEKERAAFPASEDRLRHEDIGSGERAAQETRGSTNVGDMTAVPMVQREAIQGGMMMSTIQAMSDDDPPIPVWYVTDRGKSEDNQAERVANEFERNSTDRPRDNAPAIHSTMGAHFENTADVDPPVVGTTTSTNTTLLPDAARQSATNSGAATAIVGTRTIVIPRATMVTPEDDDKPEPVSAEPVIVTPVILPFYRRKVFFYVMAAMALLVMGIAAAMQLLSNAEGSTSGLEMSTVTYNPTTSNIPTKNPTLLPTGNPMLRPTENPTLRPTNYPSSSASPSCGGSLMMIQIQYDSYPDETSYKLVKIASEDGQETELASHSGSTGDNNHEESICLDDGLYSFSFYDSFGDGFSGEYSLTLVPGETIIMRENSVSPDGEQVLFRLPFDRATLDVRWIGSNGQLLPSLLPSSSPTLTLSPSSSSHPSSSVSPSNNPTLRPTNNPSSSVSPSNNPTLRPTNYPTTSTYQAKLLASDGAVDDRFGRSVAIYGDAVVVGAYRDDNNNGPASGSAHVFVLGGEVWTLQAKLLATEGAANDWFGRSVAIYGDAIVVGAPYDDANGYNSGSAHVFVQNGEVWTHQAKLLAQDGAAGDGFGHSVAIYRDTIVVGASWDDDNGYDGGSAHVFVRSGGEWTHQAKLSAPDGAAYDYFGHCVAIYGDSIVVGAPYDDDNGLNSGSAHVFVQNGEVWIHQAKLLAPDGAAYGFFGESVAIYGDAIVGGAPYDDDNGSNSGSAHVFVRRGEEWIHQVKLLAPDGSDGDYFGESVAIYGDTIVVGASRDDDNGSNSGSAHVFVQGGEEWTHQAKLLAPDKAESDLFGGSVAIYGDKIVVGAPWDDDNGSDSGSAHIFVGW